ncbi:MAG: NUDIX domain-containing protein [Clostridia bacterium]|nr:NUDIX domain-containing protein [Clostridia bacterium]
MEIFDLFDKNRLPLNRTMIRGTKVPENCYRMVVHCIILNKAKDKMLIQKRLEEKRPFPGLWDFSCGGSSISGEKSCEAVERELFEELGYKYDFSNERPAFTFNFTEGFNDVYILSEDVDISKLKLQETEVERVEWATKEQIFELLDTKKFIPYRKELIDFIFALNTTRTIRPQ